MIPVAASGSSDAMPAGDADDPIGDVPKYELSCQNAEECGQVNLRWSEFLLCDVEASWAGKIWGWCQACSGLPPKEFKKQAKQLKLQRTNMLKEHVKTARSITFNNQMQYVEKTFPGASNTKRRELAAHRMRALSSAFTSAFD